MVKANNAQKCGTNIFFYGDIQMKDTALFAQILGISDSWRITAITPNLTDKSMTIQIDWAKGTKDALGRLCSAYSL